MDSLPRSNNKTLKTLSMYHHSFTLTHDKDPKNKDKLTLTHDEDKQMAALQEKTTQ
jgi:hypothetical protein